MQKRIPILILAFTTVFVMTQAISQNRQRDQRDRSGRGGNPIHQALDVNRDGVLNADEINNATHALLGLDVNNDGKLSSIELSRENRNRLSGQNRGRESGTNQKGDRRNQQEIPRGIRMPTPAFQTQVPDRAFDHILGRPTDSSVTVSISVYQDHDFYIEYGPAAGRYTEKTSIDPILAGETREIDLTPLPANARCFYRIHHRALNTNHFIPSEEYSFHTQRSPGNPFTFTVQADSHLDFGIIPKKYEQTLANALADKTDFHIELGDTFMVDKYSNFRQAEPQYLAQRYYFSRLCHSAPLFFVLGNHDGEFGYRDDGSSDNMSVWSANMRKKYFPNPRPTHFYTGNEMPHKEVGHLENYYAWTWGDALFITLDPFWYSTNRRGGQWSKTLGDQQYKWLHKTLASSPAKFKFIFLHYLVGGLNNETRGAKSIAHLYEWGGQNVEGENQWNSQRPGWDSPIHQLLKRHGVNVVFHGHDHLYAKEELDGVIYQAVPQPGHRRFGNTRSALDYGYTDGVILSSSGHLKVSVSEDRCTIDYIYSFLPDEEKNGHLNGEIAHSYTLDTPEP